MLLGNRGKAGGINIEMSHKTEKILILTNCSYKNIRLKFKLSMDLITSKPF